MGFVQPIIEQGVRPMAKDPNRAYIDALQEQIRLYKEQNQILQQYVEDAKRSRKYVEHQLELYQNRENLALLREKRDYERILELEHQLKLLGMDEKQEVEITYVDAEAVLRDSISREPQAKHSHEAPPLPPETASGVDDVEVEIDYSDDEMQHIIDRALRSSAKRKARSTKARRSQVRLNIPDAEPVPPPPSKPASEQESPMEALPSDPEVMALPPEAQPPFTSLASDNSADVTQTVAAKEPETEPAASVEASIDPEPLETPKPADSPASPEPVIVTKSRRRADSLESVVVPASLKSAIIEEPQKSNGSLEPVVGSEPTASPEPIAETKPASSVTPSQLQESIKPLAAPEPEKPLAAPEPEKPLAASEPEKPLKTPGAAEVINPIASTSPSNAAHRPEPETTIESKEHVSQSSQTSDVKPSESQPTELSANKSYLINEYFNRGLSASEKKDYAAAITAFTKVTELLPEAAPSYLNLGILFFRQGHYEEALKVTRQAIDRGSDPAKRLLVRIETEMEQDSEITL